MKKGFGNYIFYLAITLLFLTSVPVPSVAQRYIAKYFNNEKGNLPSALSKTILKDKAGYIWIGTDGGLIRYDGYTFKIIRDRLQSHYVKDITELSNGNLLVTTDLGISEIKNYPDSVIVKPLLKGSTVPNDSSIYYPKTVFEYNKGDLWIGETNAIIRLRNGHQKKYAIDSNYLPDSYLRTFMFTKDKYNNLWVASQAGYLFYHDTKSDSLIHIPLPGNLEHNQNFKISAIRSQPDGWIWVGTSNGLYRFHSGKEASINDWERINDIPKVSCITSIYDGKAFVGTWLDGLFEVRRKNSRLVTRRVNAIRDQNINNLSYSKDESLWISSDQGFILLYPRIFLTADLGSKSKFINSVVIDSDNTVYATNGYSIFKDLYSHDSFTMNAIDKSENNEIYSSLALMNHHLYAGTRSGHIYEIRNNHAKKIAFIETLGRRDIHFMYASDNKHLWICQDALKGIALYRPGNGISYYGPKKGASVNFNVIRSKNNMIVVGATGDNSYLYEYDERNDRFLNISAALPKSIFKGKSKPLKVNDLTFQSDNHLLLATNYGLFSISLHGLKNAVFKNLLIPGYFKSVIVDKNDDIWIGSEKGLFDSYRGEVTRFDENDGLASLSITFAGMAIDNDNHLWIGTSNGLIYSDKPVTNFSKAPKPIIRKIFVDNSPINFHSGNTIHINRGSNVQIHLTALTYPTDKVRFETILADEHDNILYQGRSVLDQLNIPVNYTGKMSIYIVTSKSGYNWSDPVILELNVSLPWYLRWWAFVLYLILFSIVVYTLIDYRRSKKIQKIEREKFERQDRIMWQTLDVVPHFVYARDSEGRYLLANKALLDAYNTTRDILIGKKDSDIINDNKEIENILSSDKKVIESGKEMKFSQDFETMDGVKKKLLVTKVPFTLNGEKSNAVAGVGVDISDLIKAQEALRESENRFKILSDASYEGIIISENGKIIDVNRRMLEISEFERDDIVGKMVWEFIPEDKIKEIEDFVQRNGEDSQESELYKKGNIRYPVILQGREFKNQGRILRMTAIRDITSEKKAEEVMKEYARKLENSNKELQDFAYVASHDLQEPLRKIQAFGDLLITDLGEKISEDAKFYLERMRSASGRMQKLINGLLNFSRVTTKAKPYEPVELKKIAREVLSDLEIRIKETGAEIKIDDLPKIDADPLQMRQLFQNIIGNALKFIKKDVKPIIRIENKTESKPDQDALKIGSETFTIVLSDNGIGFDQKYADKIFSVFERLHNRSEYEGTGIGLAICRKIVERHNGLISVQSKEGEGTSFIITLPVHQNKEKEN